MGRSWRVNDMPAKGRKIEQDKSHRIIALNVDNFGRHSYLWLFDLRKHQTSDSLENGTRMANYGSRKCRALPRRVWTWSTFKYGISFYLICANLTRRSRSNWIISCRSVKPEKLVFARCGENSTANASVHIKTPEPPPYGEKLHREINLLTPFNFFQTNSSVKSPSIAKNADSCFSAYATKSECPLLLTRRCTNPVLPLEWERLYRLSRASPRWNKGYVLFASLWRIFWVWEVLQANLIRKKIKDLEEEKRQLEQTVLELKAKCEAVEKRESERRAMEERKHAEEIAFLKKTNLQLKVCLPFRRNRSEWWASNSVVFYIILKQTQLEGILSPQKK